MMQAVILDMDGLMYNTEVMFLETFPELCKKRGIDFSKEKVKQLIGCDSRRVAMFEEEYPGIIDAMQQLQNERIEVFHSFFKEPGSANKKGLKELITYMEGHHIPYAIASSSSPEAIQSFNAHAGFAFTPTAVVSSKMENIPSKPDPAIFLRAAELLKAEPQNCLVLEDGKYGILAAKRAGMRSVFIKDQVEPDEEMKAAIDLECKSLDEVIPLLKP